MSSWYEQIMSLAQEDSPDTQDPTITDEQDPPDIDTSLRCDGRTREALLDFVQNTLSTQERLVIMLRYCEELTLPEIGAVLNQPTARIVHLHDQVVARVRKWLNAGKATEALVS